MKSSNGYLLLEGGGEFQGEMAAVDLQAMELAGGKDCRIEIIPAAAAPDNNHFHAGQNGVDWFRSLGAAEVISRPLIDRDSACDATLAAPLRDADFIFLLGGFPAYLAETLAESICWQYALAALARGAVLGGSSAGAMILADHFYDPYSDTVKPGLGLLRGCCIIPHFRRFGARWQKLLSKALPEAVLIGIDEYTGIINDFPGGGWTVHGAGRVYLGGGGRQMLRFRAGEVICDDALQVPRI